MGTGSYTFNEFENQSKEMARLNLQSKISLEKERAFLLKVGLQSDMKVLDVGCGAGETSALMAAVAFDGSVIGVDQSTSLLKRARKKRAFNLDFRLGDVYQLAFAENSFDFVYGRFLFQHLDDPQLALNQLFKVLKPGGRIVLLDVDDGYFSFQPVSASLESFLAQVENAQAAKGGDRRVGRKLKDYIKANCFMNVIEIQEKISSKELGVRNFLDLTTGLKLEHLSEELRNQAKEDLKFIYAEALEKNAIGEITLFGVTGEKPF